MEKTEIELIKERAKKEQKNKKPLTAKIPAYNTKTQKLETRELIIRSGKEGSFFKRIVFIMFIILLEIIFLAFIYTQFILSFLWFLFIPYGLGIIFACRVAVSGKNYDSKIAWILFLLVLAPVAIFVYLLAGEMTATPIKSRRLKRISENTKFLSKAQVSDSLPPRVRQDCNFIQNTSDYVPFYGSNTEYFATGESFFDDVFKKLRQAEKFIFIDFFVLEDGYLSEALFAILKERAQAGVDIRIIIDGLGSHGTLSASKIYKIRKSGIKLVAFEPIIPLINFLMNYRDHRKILIIDGHTGYVGGTNIADEYINAKERFGVWKDASVRIEGGAVEGLTLMFLRMWEYSSREKPDYGYFLNMSKMNGNGSGSVIIPYADGVSEKQKLGRAVYSNIISNAQKSLYIMTPYFIVDNAVIAQLIAKAQSGVDVRLILPGIPDKKLIYSLSLSNAEKLVNGGVRVYTYTPGFLHSKVMLSDGECAVVGSINMDFRSFYQQYESAAYIAGSDALRTIATDFNDTFTVSKEMQAEEIKKRNVFVRIWLAFLRLFAPLM